MQAALVVLQMALGILLPLAVQRWDRGRLPASHRDAWSGTSRAAAVACFNEFSLLGWWWVTRRSPRALGGLLPALGVFLVVRWALPNILAAWAPVGPVPTFVEAVVGFLAAAVVFGLLWLVAVALGRR